MTVKEASAKTSMSYSSGKHYYAKHLEDTDQNIFIPQWRQSYTQG
jgi:hypothetical protein